MQRPYGRFTRDNPPKAYVLRLPASDQEPKRGMRGGSMRLELAGRGAARNAFLQRTNVGSLPVSVKILAVAVIGMTAANCSAPQTVATSSRRGIDPKYGVAASPRVVGENDPVPKGGGREMVGKPYVVAGRTYVPRENPTGYVRVGLASWYGTAFHGRLTANGEIFDRYSIAAAHPTLPLPSYARVTNLQNKRSMIVRVNDRGPYHANRLMDVSQQVAEALDFKHVGTSRVRVEYVGRASTRGSDDNKLLATLRTDGRPAPFPGRASIMVADAGESASPPAWSPPSPRGVDASRSGEADAEPAAVPAPAMAPSLAAAQPRAVVRTAIAATLVKDEEPAPAKRVAAGAPLPPERPYGLGATPKTAMPVPGTSSAIPSRVADAPPRRPAYADLRGVY
jgi:rare lipoprotein A